MNWTELNELASSNDNFICNDYTDREESEN